nr:hypothetical protein [Mesorhizobium carmichaelinearum]
MIQQLPGPLLVRQWPRQSVLQRLPIGDEVVEVQRLVVRPLLLSATGRVAGYLLTRARSSTYKIGLPAPSCSRCLCPGWSHHTPQSRKPQPDIGTEVPNGAHEGLPVVEDRQMMVFKLVMAAAKSWRRLKDKISCRNCSQVPSSRMG